MGERSLSLDEPTKPMQKDAVEAGSYTYNMTGQKYPVIQFGNVPLKPSTVFMKNQGKIHPE